MNKQLLEQAREIEKEFKETILLTKQRYKILKQKLKTIKAKWKDICECQHPKNEHSRFRLHCCLANYCDCKQFKPNKETKEFAEICKRIGV